MRSATQNHPDTGEISFREAARATLRALKREGRSDVLLSHALSGKCPEHNQLIIRDIGANDISLVNDLGQVALINEENEIE